MSDESSAKHVVVYLGPADPQSDLEPMKLYRVVAAEPGDPEDHLRVIDESGEDYLYPAKLFAELSVPKRVEDALPTAG